MLSRFRASGWFAPILLLSLALVTALAGWLTPDKKYSDIPTLAGPEESPVEGGVFRFPLLGYFETLDPARARFDVEVLLVQQLFDGLTAFDDQLNVVPALAQYWRIEDDGKTYTFELRDDAKFHNSRPVTAEDCVFSFERLLSKELNESNYQYYSRIEGAQEFRDGSTDHVAGLRAIDDRTFQIRFTTPYVPALSVLSMYSSKILPKEELLAMGEEAFFEQPVGTGAFSFSRWIGHEEDPALPIVDGIPQGVRVEANPFYFAGRPYLDAVVFRAVTNREGFAPTAPLSERFDCLETTADSQAWSAVEARRLLALKYVILPTHIAPYDDPRVRRALNYALDKRSFLDVVAATAGTPEANGIIPPGIPGFASTPTKHGHDLEEARRLLAEAGFPDGMGLPPLEIPVLQQSENDEYPRPSSVRRGCLESCFYKLGVTIKHIPVDQLVEIGDPAYADRPVLYGGTWFADFPDPDSFLRPLFHTDGAMNQNGYSNVLVDDLLDQVVSETSYTKRTKTYREVERLVLLDSPIIPTDYGRLRYLVRPNVRGFRLIPLGTGYINLRHVWLIEDESESEVEL